MAERNDASLKNTGPCRLLSSQRFTEFTADEVGRALRYDRPLSVALLRIDELAIIRRGCGQAAGDGLTLQLAWRLIDAARHVDQVGKYSRTLIGISLPETTANQCGRVMERLRRVIGATSFEFAEQSHDVTASIGTATLSAHLRDPEILLGTACSELRRARRLGGDRVCSAPQGVTPMTLRRSASVH